jgi:GATA-binding protein, other eukaryote
MAAITSTPMATSSPLTSMNPTSTEHDFRFPRRPNEQQSQQNHPVVRQPDSNAASPSHSKSSAGDIRMNLQELKLEISTAQQSTQDDFLSAAIFPNFSNGAASMSKSPEELQKQDPLATQVWKFFTRTKQLLPEQQRMENLTWRMMHVNLRKKQQEELENEGTRYETIFIILILILKFIICHGIHVCMLRLNPLPLSFNYCILYVMLCSEVLFS